MSIRFFMLPGFNVHGDQGSRVDHFLPRLMPSGPWTLPVEPIWLHADPTRLGLVVGNLLNNSASSRDSRGYRHSAGLSSSWGTGGKYSLAIFGDDVTMWPSSSTTRK
jgi:hypothetical protein